MLRSSIVIKVNRLNKKTDMRLFESNLQNECDGIHLEAWQIGAILMRMPKIVGLITRENFAS